MTRAFPAALVVALTTPWRGSTATGRVARPGALLRSLMAGFGRLD